MRRNLLRRYEYRGYADASTTIDDTSRTMAVQYTAFGALLDADRPNTDLDRCREAATRLLAVFPPDDSYRQEWTHALIRRSVPPDAAIQRRNARPLKV